MSKLADAIAHQEGFYVSGSLPQRCNNPGDLRHGPGEFHPDNQPDAVGSFPDEASGWAALERQLNLDASRGWNLGRLIYTYAPPEENNSAAYLSFVIKFLGEPATPDMLVSDALQLGDSNDGSSSNG
jgi:hypothetical protein